MVGVLMPSFLSVDADKVELFRSYRSGEKLTYQFSSQLDVGVRSGEIDVFIPENVKYTYNFTLTTEKEKPEGTADVRFRRPNVTIHIGETFEDPPTKEEVKTDENILFTLSRTNQVLSLKDESPKKKDKDKGNRSIIATASAVEQQRAQDVIRSWFQQLFQLAAFVNFYDLGPLLPGHPVAVGDTWKQTVGYQPMQITAGADKGKPIMGRLDYEYTYRGRKELDGKQVVWIVAKLHNESDASPYVASRMGVELEDSPFKAIKLKISAEVEYFLDPVTLITLKVASKSEGNAHVVVEGVEGPIEEVKFESRGSLTKK